MFTLIGINTINDKEFHYLTDGKAFMTGNSFYLLNDNIITDEGNVIRRLTRQFVG